MGKRSGVVEKVVAVCARYRTFAASITIIP
jgi:hypothetical protein